MKSITICMDGKAWIAYDAEQFIDMQTSNCYAYGETPFEALRNLLPIESEFHIICPHCHCEFKTKFSNEDVEPNKFLQSKCPECSNMFWYAYKKVNMSTAIKPENYSKVREDFLKQKEGK